MVSFLVFIHSYIFIATMGYLLMSHMFLGAHLQPKSMTSITFPVAAYFECCLLSAVTAAVFSYHILLLWTSAMNGLCLLLGVVLRLSSLSVAGNRVWRPS